MWFRDWQKHSHTTCGERAVDVYGKDSHSEHEIEGKQDNKVVTVASVEVHHSQKIRSCCKETEKSR